MGLQDGSKKEEVKGDLENANPIMDEMACPSVGQKRVGEGPIGKCPSFLDKDNPSDEPITKVNELPLVPPLLYESTHTLGEVSVPEDVKID